MFLKSVDLCRSTNFTYFTIIWACVNLNKSFYTYMDEFKKIKKPINVCLSPDPSFRDVIH